MLSSEVAPTGLLATFFHGVTLRTVWLRHTKAVPARRCASEAEEQSALYNMACAYAALGKRDSALTCLEVRAAPMAHRFARALVDMCVDGCCC